MVNILLLSILISITTIVVTYILLNRSKEYYNLLDLSNNELPQSDDCKYPKFIDKCGNCINKFDAYSKKYKPGFLNISKCCINTNDHPIDSDLDCLHITDDCSGNKYLDKCGNCISRTVRQYQINNWIANKDGISNDTQCCINTGLGINGEKPDCNGVCGGDAGSIPEGDCDCSGNQLDASGNCGGYNLSNDDRCRNIKMPHIITNCGQCMNKNKREMEIKNKIRSKNDTKLLCNDEKCIDTQCCIDTGLGINGEKPDCNGICGGDGGSIPEGDCDCSGNQLDASGNCGGGNLSNDERCNQIEQPHVITNCGECMNKIYMESLVKSKLLNQDGADFKTGCCPNTNKSIDNNSPNHCGLCANYGPNGYPLLENGEESCNCKGGQLNKCNECVTSNDREYNIKNKIISENDTKLLCKKYDDNYNCIEYQDSQCCSISGLGVNGEKPDCNGICNNQGYPEGDCDCEGNKLNACGECGGQKITILDKSASIEEKRRISNLGEQDPRLLTKIDINGNEVPKVTGDQCSCNKCYDMSGNLLDINNENDCIKNGHDWTFDVIDECGVCGGNSEIPEGNCDCSGNVIDECGICGGNGPNPSTKCCPNNLSPTNIPQNQCGICEDKLTKDYPNGCCPPGSPIYPNLSLTGYGPDASGNCGGMVGLNNIVPTDVKTARSAALQLGLSLGNTIEPYRQMLENKYCQDMIVDSSLNTLEDCLDDCSGNPDCNHIIYNDNLGIGNRCYKQNDRCNLKTSSTGSRIYSFNNNINMETDRLYDMSNNDFTGDYYVKGFHSYKKGPNFGKAYFGIGGTDAEVKGAILSPITVKDAEEVATNLGLNLGGPFKEFLGYYDIKGLHAYKKGPNANCAFFGLAGTVDEMRADINIRDENEPYRPIDHIYRPRMQNACDASGNILDDCGMCTYGNNRKMLSDDDEVNKTICCQNTNKTLLGTPCN